MIPLGRRTYLDAKAKGETSMFEKAGCSETIKGQARRDPDGTVKAGLPEPQWPYCNLSGWIRWLTSNVLMTGKFDYWSEREGIVALALHAPEDWVGITNLKATNREPKPS